MAISLFIGLLIRNEKVALLGILACVNPKNRGIEEQEQNGVSMPNMAANRLPTNCDFPLMKSLTVSVFM